MFYNSLIRTCALLVLVSPMVHVYAELTAWEQDEDTKLFGASALLGLAVAGTAYGGELEAQKGLQRLQKIQSSRTLRSKLSNNGSRIAKDYSYLHQRFFVPLSKLSQTSRAVKWLGLVSAALNTLVWGFRKKLVDDDLERKLQRIELDARRSSQRN
jgi:CHASE1-domain containing sensor protein